MRVSAAHARLAALVYAGCLAVLGIAVLTVTGVLVSTFGLSATTPTFFAVTVLPAALFLALSPFVRRQQPWAMIAALLVAVALRYLLGAPNPAIGALLVVLPVLFAACTAICFMANPEPG